MKYEYYVRYFEPQITDETQKILDNLGQFEWELITTIKQITGFVAFFKRPIVRPRVKMSDVAESDFGEPMRETNKTVEKLPPRSPLMMETTEHLENESPSAYCKHKDNISKCEYPDCMCLAYPG